MLLGVEPVFDPAAMATRPVQERGMSSAAVIPAIQRTDQYVSAAGGRPFLLLVSL
jgi:hypothetical protein